MSGYAPSSAENVGMYVDRSTRRGYPSSQLFRDTYWRQALAFLRVAAADPGIDLGSSTQLQLSDERPRKVLAHPDQMTGNKAVDGSNHL